MPEEKRTLATDYKLCLVFNASNHFGCRGYKLTDSATSYCYEYTRGFSWEECYQRDMMFVPRNETGWYFDKNKVIKNWIWKKEATAKRLLEMVPEGMSYEEYLAPLFNSGYGHPIEVPFETYLSVDLGNTAFKHGDKNDFCSKVKARILDALYKKYPIKRETTDGRKLGDLLPDFYSEGHNIVESHMRYKVILPDEYKTHEGFVSAIRFEEMTMLNENLGRAIIPVRFEGTQFVKCLKNTCPPFTKESELEKKYGGKGVPLNTSAGQQSFRYQMDLLKYRDRLEIVTAMYRPKNCRYGEEPVQFARLSKKAEYAANPVESQVYDEVRNSQDITRTNWFPLIVQVFMLSDASSKLMDMLGHILKSSANGVYVVNSGSGFSSPDTVNFYAKGDFSINFDHGPDSKEMVTVNDLKKRFKENAETLKTLHEEFENIVNFLENLHFDHETPLEMKDFFVKLSSQIIQCDPLGVMNLCNRTNPNGSRENNTDYLEIIGRVAAKLIN